VWEGFVCERGELVLYAFINKGKCSIPCEKGEAIVQGELTGGSMSVEMSG